MLEHRKVDKSEQEQWRRVLAEKGLKVRRKEIERTFKRRILKEEVWTDRDHVIVAINFFGNPVTIKCHTREECLENLATLNGYTIIK